MPNTKLPINLVLPWPPSVNHYWGTAKGGRRYLTKAAIAFRREVWWRSGRRPGVHFDHGLPVAVEIILCPPDKRLHDIDNYSKAILDAMAHAKLYDDDKQIKRLLIEYGNVEKGGRVMVTAEEMI